MTFATPFLGPSGHTLSSLLSILHSQVKSVFHLKVMWASGLELTITNRKWTSLSFVGFAAGDKIPVFLWLK